MKRKRITDEKYAERFSDLGVGERHILTLKEAMPIKGKKVLDVGCANGKTLKYIERFGPNAVGIDVVGPLVEKAKKNTRFPVQVADANNIPFKDSSFDIVLCMDMIEHTKTQSKVLSEISRVTKKGGKVVLSTNGPYFKWSYRKGSSQQIENTPDTITLPIMMSLKGLKIYKLIGLDNTFSKISSKNPIKRFVMRMGEKAVNLLYKLNAGWLFPNTILIVAVRCGNSPERNL